MAVSRYIVGTPTLLVYAFSCALWGTGCTKKSLTAAEAEPKVAKGRGVTLGDVLITGDFDVAAECAPGARRVMSTSVTVPFTVITPKTTAKIVVEGACGKTSQANIDKYLVAEFLKEDTNDGSMTTISATAMRSTSETPAEFAQVLEPGDYSVMLSVNFQGLGVIPEDGKVTFPGEYVVVKGVSIATDKDVGFHGPEESFQ